MLFRVLDGVVACQFPLPHRGDNLKEGVQRHDRNVKANLVVALAGRAVGNSVRPLFFRDSNHPLGDQRPGDGSAYRILAFVQCVRLYRGKNVILDELLPGVNAVSLYRADFLCLFLYRLQVFLTLPDLKRQGYDLGIIFFLEPLYRNAGVKTARICKHDFHYMKILFGLT